MVDFRPHVRAWLVLVRIGVSRGQRGGNRVHPRLCLLDRHAGLEPRHRIQHPRAALFGDGRDRPRRRVPRDRRPHLGGILRNRKLEAWRRHSDDRVRLPVDHQRRADDRRIAAQSPSPQLVAQDHGAFRRVFFAWQEPAPQGGLHVEHREQIRRDDLASKMDGLVCSGQREFGIAVADDVLEDVVLGAEVEERGIRQVGGVRRAADVA